jgi:hypothetical protein
LASLGDQTGIPHVFGERAKHPINCNQCRGSGHTHRDITALHTIHWLFLRIGQATTQIRVGLSQLLSCAILAIQSTD